MQTLNNPAASALKSPGARYATEQHCFHDGPLDIDHESEVLD